MKTLILIFITFLHYAHSQGAWMMSNRTHPELDWRTIKTENFNIHYHEDIYEIALKGANIAEKVRPILMEQVGLKELKRLDIVFTAEDEVMNGFAVPANYTVIWVDQNDVAVWTEDEKWLRTVVAHELQHLVYFNVIKSWLPAPMDQLYGQTPSWVVEGLAEYYTESNKVWIGYKDNVMEELLARFWFCVERKLTITTNNLVGSTGEWRLKLAEVALALSIIHI